MRGGPAFWAQVTVVPVREAVVEIGIQFGAVSWSQLSQGHSSPPGKGFFWVIDLRGCVSKYFVVFSDIRCMTYWFRVQRVSGVSPGLTQGPKTKTRHNFVIGNHGVNSGSLMVIFYLKLNNSFLRKGFCCYPNRLLSPHSLLRGINTFYLFIYIRNQHSISLERSKLTFCFRSYSSSHVL